MSSFAYDQWVAEARAIDIAEYASSRHDLKLSSTKDGYVGPCPECGGDDRFVVTSNHKKQVFRCRNCQEKGNKDAAGDIVALVRFLEGCTFIEAVEKLTGRPKPPSERKSKLGKIVAQYPYNDKTGALAFEVVRYEPKNFRQRRPDGNGGWIWNLDGVQLVPYRLPQLCSAIASVQRVLCVEGEKDVATAESLGFAATCAPGGVGMGWRSEYDQHFANADVLVVPDNDTDKNKGAKLAGSIAAHLSKVASRVRWLELPNTAKDITEWKEAGGTRDELEALIAAAPNYEAPNGALPPADDDAAAAAKDNAEFERLAKLPLIEYDRARKAAAKKLGITRVSTLDTVVEAKRIELGLIDDDGKQGQAITFPEVEPWPEPVDGAQLLNMVAGAIRRHVVVNKHGYHICALWAVHTYLIEHFPISPKLFIHSPTPRCGKSTLLDVLSKLVARPMLSASITSAAVFRIISMYQPTLLIDELDSFLGDNNDLRGILNSSHRYDGCVSRVVGEKLEPRNFKVYTAIALASIGSLPSTLMDRALIVNLQRRQAKEKIEPLRVAQVEHLSVIRRKMVRWTNDQGKHLHPPELPANIINRMSDNWLPLWAIADAAGGRWPARARAAMGQAYDKAEESSQVELLLSDIRDVFANTTDDRIPSADLISQLVEIVPRPWAEYTHGRPITQNKLARLLKPLGIAPQGLRTEHGKTPRGYFLHQFRDAFARFLGAAQKGVSETQNAPQSAVQGGPNRNSATNAGNKGSFDLF